MGQAKRKLRSCPAVNHEITGAECGENRQSRYACPEACPFNPFSQDNYTALLDVETRLDHKAFRAVMRDDPSAGPAIDRARTEDGDIGMHAAATWRIFFHRDATGRTFARRWEDAGLDGSNNDARVLWRGKMQTRASAFEVRRIIDAERFEVIDLLDAARPSYTVVDRSMGARVGRFAVLLVYAYPLPHFWRFVGAGVEIAATGGHDPETIVREILAHLGAPADPGGAQSRWLAENFARVNAAVTATALQRREQMLGSADAQFGTACYELNTSVAECQAALVVDDAVDRDELSPGEEQEGLTVALVWFAGRSSRVGAPGVPVLGRVLLGNGRARVEAMGAQRLSELRNEFESRLGPRARFTQERRTNYGAQLAGADPTFDRTLVPPRLLEEPEQIQLESSRLPGAPPGISTEDYAAMVRREQRRRWFDEKIPALGGKTPRQAACDVALRPRLVALVKRQVRELDQENLRTGGREDLNDLIRELGLPEIDVPPPPPRSRIDDESDEETGDEREATAVSEKRLPDRPLDTAESLVRLDQSLARFERAADAMADLERVGATVLSDLDKLTADTLSEDDFSFLVPQALHVWFALVPAGATAPLRYQAMAASFRSDLDRMAQKGPRSAEAMMRIMDSARQPHFFQLVLAGLFEVANKAPRKQRPSPESLFIMAFALKALVDELDVALRR